MILFAVGIKSDMCSELNPREFIYELFLIYELFDMRDKIIHEIEADF